MKDLNTYLERGGSIVFCGQFNENYEDMLKIKIKKSISISSSN